MTRTRAAARFIFLALFAACTAGTLQAQDNSARRPDSSATSLDWDGVYRGVVPCADCEGIETTVTLEKDGFYRLQTRYLGRNVEPFEQRGTFVWDAAGGTVVLDGLKDRPSRYLVGENHLLQLDMEGKRITGALADRYRLEKVVQKQPTEAISLTETTWKLTELYGQPVKAAQPGKEPYLVLTAQDSRIQGFGGCNRFAGSYELKDGFRIRFSGIAATMMACPAMEIESEFFKALQETDNYSLGGNNMSLNRARMAPLARFEAAAAP